MTLNSFKCHLQHFSLSWERSGGGTCSSPRAGQRCPFRALTGSRKPKAPSQHALRSGARTVSASRRCQMPREGAQLPLLSQLPLFTLWEKGQEPISGV